MIKAKQWRRVLIGTVLTVGGAWYYRPFLGSFLGEFALPCVCFVTGYLISVTVSWGAYAFAAHQRGYQFHLASIGPLQIAREMGGVRVRRNRERAPVEVVMLPASSHELRRRTMRLLWAAPGATFVSALVSAILLSLIVVASPFGAGIVIPVFISAGSVPIARHDTFGGLLGVIALVAFPLGLVAASTTLFCLLSVLNAFIRHDGAQSTRSLWMMLRANGPDATQYLARLVLSGQSWSGVRPRMWDRALIAEATARIAGETHSPLDSTLSAYWHALDSGDSEDMAELLADLSGRVDESVPELYAATIPCEAAFHAAWFRGDASARELLPAKQALKRERQRFARAEAAVLLAEGRAYEAWTCATEGGLMLNEANNLGVAAMEGDLLNAIMARAVSAAPSPVRTAEATFVGEIPPYAT